MQNAAIFEYQSFLVVTECLSLISDLISCFCCLRNKTKRKDNFVCFFCLIAESDISWTIMLCIFQILLQVSVFLKDSRYDS